MCRSIRTLYNFTPPATDEEVRAVLAVAAATRRLVDRLVTAAPPRDRETEQARARERWRRRSADSR
jgi:hypothetical protein